MDVCFKKEQKVIQMNNVFALFVAILMSSCLCSCSRVMEMKSKILSKATELSGSSESKNSSPNAGGTQATNTSDGSEPSAAIEKLPNASYKLTRVQCNNAPPAGGYFKQISNQIHKIEGQNWYRTFVFNECKATFLYKMEYQKDGILMATPSGVVQCSSEKACNPVLDQLFKHKFGGEINPDRYSYTVKQKAGNPKVFTLTYVEGADLCKATQSGADPLSVDIEEVPGS